MFSKTEAINELNQHIMSEPTSALHPHTFSAEVFKEILFEAYSYEKGDLDNLPVLLLYIVSYLSHQNYGIQAADLSTFIKTSTFEVDFTKYCEEVKNVNKIRYYSVQVPKEIARHISAQHKSLHYSINPMLLDSVYMSGKVV